MHLWENEDRETPIENYPGYLGLTWDGTFLAQIELRPLQDFDIMKYSDLVDEHGGERRLDVSLPSGPIKISFNAYDDIAHILDQLPTVKVYLDNGRPVPVPPQAVPAFFSLKTTLES
jgi:hypothetical protein